MGEVLGCIDPSLQETHFGACEHSSTLWNSLEQLGHLLIPMQASFTWPYSWHLMHHIGICRSLQTFTNWSSTQMRPVRRQFAVSGFEHVTLSVVEVCLGDLLSGHLHKTAEVIKPSPRSLSHSIACKCVLLLGSNWPWHGTKWKMSGKVWCCIHALGLILVSKNRSLSHSLMKLSFDSEDSNLSRRAGLSSMVTLQIAWDGVGGASPSRVGSLLSIQLLKSCLSSCWALINFSLGVLFSSNGPYLIRSCFEASKTWCRSWGLACGAAREFIRDAGWTEWMAIIGDITGRRGHVAELRSLDIVAWLSLSMDLARASLLCCLTKSCRVRRSEACCCEVASRNFLADVAELRSRSMGLLTLLVIISMSLSDTTVARSSSAWSQSKWATELMPMSVSVGSLNANTTEKRISASFVLVHILLVSTQPFVLSQVLASFTEETGPDVALSCASRSALGEKSQLPSKGVLNRICERLHKSCFWFWMYLPCQGVLTGYLRAQKKILDVSRCGQMSNGKRSHVSGIPVHTELYTSRFVGVLSYWCLISCVLWVDMYSITNGWYI
jgi:hypothetical protein